MLDHENHYGHDAPEEPVELFALDQTYADNRLEYTLDFNPDAPTLELTHDDRTVERTRDETFSPPPEEAPAFDFGSFLVGDAPPSPGPRLLKCETCGRGFATRSAKSYHKTKHPKGTGCNVPSPKGRPHVYSREESRQRRVEAKASYKLRVRLNKMLNKQKSKANSLMDDLQAEMSNGDDTISE